MAVVACRERNHVSLSFRSQLWGRFTTVMAARAEPIAGDRHTALEDLQYKSRCLIPCWNSLKNGAGKVSFPNDIMKCGELPSTQAESADEGAVISEGTHLLTGQIV